MSDCEPVWIQARDDPTMDARNKGKEIEPMGRAGKIARLPGLFASNLTPASPTALKPPRPAASQSIKLNQA